MKSIIFRSPNRKTFPKYPCVVDRNLLLGGVSRRGVRVEKPIGCQQPIWKVLKKEANEVTAIIETSIKSSSAISPAAGNEA